MTPPPLGLYVHLPWCVRKCPYCDFNSHPLHGTLPVDDYLAALLRDADEEAVAAGGRRVETVFIGGGTPSLFPPEAIGRLLAGLGERLALSPTAEITLEANPGTAETGRFAAYREAGVTRVSLGVQSLDAAQLHTLGRIHGPDEARAAARELAAAGLASHNLDLMYALPGQTPETAEADARALIALDAPHLSCYQLTLEPGTAFAARPPALPDEDAAFDIQERVHARLREAGYRRYEVSAWSRPGHECRHNLNYWRFGDYLAIGAGAHGKLTLADGTIRRYQRHHMPRQYMSAPTRGPATWRDLNDDERVLELMMNAMRLPDGIAAGSACERAGMPLSAFESGRGRAVALGLMADDPDTLRPTERGQLFLNDLLACFLPEPS
ncbi:Oxygen-independent coproporphyrinogen-III oxidase-like protein [wastewater metagenome]|uniref:Oxygen-independent coproporphyrinogen-III oxidase-like protein n=2 Tax=unclassified sequences TaxID=12908 RepID=A0A5B8R8K2_9ZZZZ|nr:radical SAM family heme chaperone HemW [Arhodomonas sp. KWT]QEA05040.1 oxygen-independent coproporphyrinogen-III oxidase-like protein [uncultured organism]